MFQVLEFNQFSTGSVHQMFQAAVGLRERGHEVTIVSRPGSELPERAAAAGIGFIGLRMRNEFDLRSIAALRRHIRKEKPDVIHVHKGVAHSIALAATIGNRVGAFVVNRGVSFALDVWNRGKFRTKRVDRIVTVCQQNKDVVVSTGKIPDEKVLVVFAGTDVNFFDPGRNDPRAFRREKGIPDARYVISQVGLRDWKGWKELIDAVADVVPQHPSVQLVLIGDPKRHEDVRTYAAAKGIAGHVLPVEFRNDMPNVFASSDLVVDASWAGTGITGTIREAMAMRKPVIATTAGGNDELITSPAVGWLIPMKDQKALAGAIRDVIENPDRAAAIGRAAREHVVRGYSKELRIRRLEELYQSILREKGLSA